MSLRNFWYLRTLFFLIMGSHALCKHGDPLSYVFQDLCYFELEYNGKNEDGAKKYACMCYAPDRHSRFEKLSIIVDGTAKKATVSCETGGKIITMQISDMENADHITLELHETDVAKKSRGYMNNETLHTRYLEAIDYAPEPFMGTGGSQHIKLEEDVNGNKLGPTYSLMFCRPPFKDMKAGHIMLYNSDMAFGVQKSKVSAKIEPTLDRSSKILALTLVMKLSLTTYTHLLEMERDMPEPPTDPMEKLLRTRTGVAQELVEDFKEQFFQKEKSGKKTGEPATSASSPITHRKPVQGESERSMPASRRGYYGGTFSGKASSFETRTSASPERQPGTSRDEPSAQIGAQRSPPRELVQPRSQERSPVHRVPMEFLPFHEGSPSAKREDSRSPSRSPTSTGSRRL